jgi:hypothetical protein
MFNMLNTLPETGKQPPMVCKILDSLSVFFRGILLPSERPFYLLERMGLRNHGFQAFGLRIAFTV